MPYIRDVPSSVSKFNKTTLVNKLSGFVCPEMTRKPTYKGPGWAPFTTGQALRYYVTYVCGVNKH